MPSPLLIIDLVRRYDAHTVLDGFSLTVPPGARIGIVGENGSGKSTLMRTLAKVDPPDSGAIEIPADVVYLGQEPPFGDRQTVQEVLRQALAPLHAQVTLVERLATEAPTSAEYADALETAIAHDAWDADRRAAEAAARLGVADLPDNRMIGSLSGGERTRLALAALITRRPECVLLDEPTNHLDDASMQLLEEFLVGLPGIVIAASHDRVFLDAVATRIIDLDPGELGDQAFTGSFADYLAARQAARARWEQTYQDQQGELKRLRADTLIDTSAIAHNRPPTDGDRFIYKFKGANVERTLARRLHQAQRRLDEAERNQVRKPRPPLKFDAPLTGTTRARIAVRNLAVTGRLRVEHLDVEPGGHLLVTGPNGSGKTTLLRVLAGDLKPDQGTVDISARRLAWLKQDVRFRRPEASARWAYADLTDDDRPPLRELGLIHPRDLAKPVNELSVGQRRRLGLAIVIAQRPDVLLLDEPTNHLSLSLAAELEEALQAAPGTVILASHDRWLRRRWDGATLDLTQGPGPKTGALHKKR